MAEELRIVVRDEGGVLPVAPQAQPEVPSTPAELPSAPAVPAVEAPEADVPTVPPVEPGKAPELDLGPLTDKIGELLGAASGAGVPGASQVASQFATATGAVKGFAAALGPVGVALGGVAVALGAVAVASKLFSRVVQEEVNNLAGVSAPVAAAVARAEVGREAQLLRRAERIGATVAEAEDIRARFEDVAFDIGTEIKGQLLEVVNSLGPLLELVATISSGIAPLIRFQGEIAKATNPIAQIANGVELFLRLWQGQQQDELDELDPVLEMFFNNVGGMTPVELKNRTGIPNVDPRPPKESR